MERLKTKNTKDESELSLIERILVNESDPKLAAIFALDLILVGIDTVRYYKKSNLKLSNSLIVIIFVDFNGSLLNFIPISHET